MKSRGFEHFTVEKVLKYDGFHAFKDPKDTKRLAEDLRKAGPFVTLPMKLTCKEIIISQLPSRPFLQQTLAPYLPQYLSLPLSVDFCLYEPSFQPP